MFLDTESKGILSITKKLFFNKSTFLNKKKIKKNKTCCSNRPIQLKNKENNL